MRLGTNWTGTTTLTLTGARTMCSEAASLTSFSESGMTSQKVNVKSKGVCAIEQKFEYVRGTPVLAASSAATMVKLICLGWSGMPNTNTSALILPHHPHDDALNLNLVWLHEQRLHGSVRRLKANPSSGIPKELLQCDVRPTKQGDYHLAVFGRLAILDDNKVAIANLLVDHRVAPNAEHVAVPLADQVFGDADGLLGYNRLDGLAGRDVSQQRQFESAASASGGDHLNRATTVPRSLDEALLLKVAQVLVNGGKRRQTETTTYLLETRCVAVLLNEFVEVIQDFPLTFRERKHQFLLCFDSHYTQKKGENQMTEVTDQLWRPCRWADRMPRVRFPFRVPSRGSRPVDVVGLGLNSIDLMAVVDDYPTSNTKQPLKQFGRFPGGQIATAMVACARLGWTASYIGRFGDDELGQLSRFSLTSEGVDINASSTVPGATNQFAVVIVDAHNGDRTVLWDRHPALTMTAEDVPEAAVVAGRMLIVDCHDTQAAARAAQLGRQAGSVTVVDVEHVRPGIASLLRHIDAIITAQEFPCELTGYGDVGRALAALAQEFSAPVACVTLGEEGSLALAGGREIKTPAFHPGAVVDSTGAGDAFRGGFAAGCLTDPDGELEDALRYANAVAGLNCAALGARGGLPRVAELDRLLQSVPVEETRTRA